MVLQPHSIVTVCSNDHPADVGTDDSVRSGSTAKPVSIRGMSQLALISLIRSNAVSDGDAGPEWVISATPSTERSNTWRVNIVLPGRTNFSAPFIMGLVIWK